MKKILCLLLTVCMGLSLIAFAGCGNEKKETEDFKSPLPQISDFESLDEVYSRMTFLNRFGKVTLNSDKNYVTKGNSSLRLEVHGDYAANTDRPVMQVNFTSLETENVPYIDLSKLESVEMDLFNGTESQQELEVSLIVDGVATDFVKVQAEAGENIDLAAEFDVKGLSVGSDMKKAEALQIKFPKPSSMDEGPMLFYMDNLRFTFLASAPAPIEIELDENEFCSFDKSYQKYVVQSGGIGPTEGCRPVLSINSDLQYCKNYTGRSLKVVLPRGTSPINDGWPYFMFIEKLIDEIDFVKLMNDGAEMVFDVYNEGSAYNFALEASTDIAGLSGAVAFTANNGWTEVRVPLKSLMGNVKNEVSVAERVNKIFVSYGKFDSPDKTFYFDNFRFEFPSENK